MKPKCSAFEVYVFAIYVSKVCTRYICMCLPLLYHKVRSYVVYVIKLQEMLHVLYVVDYLLHDSHLIAIGSNKVATLWAYVSQSFTA